MNRSRAFPSSVGVLPDNGVLSFLRLLWAIDHGMQQRSRSMARTIGVTGLQRLVIRILGVYPRLTPSQLAALLHLHASTVTDVVQRLQRRGLLLRRIDPADRRRFRLVLTARGRAIGARRKDTIETLLQGVLAEVAAEDLAAAERVLSAVGQRLSEEG